jgi:hypothetical protein
MKTIMKLFTVLCFLVLFSCNSSAPKTSSKSEPGSNTASTEPVKSAPEPKPSENKVVDFNKLTGEWLRSDGGKSIRINSVSADGKLDAAYFNPNPIRVGRAAWVIKDNILVAVIELRDINYPGSTYTLQYFPEEDVLAGNYFQAVENANYDVEFSRQK